MIGFAPESVEGIRSSGVEDGSRWVEHGSKDVLVKLEIQIRGWIWHEKLQRGTTRNGGSCIPGIDNGGISVVQFTPTLVEAPINLNGIIYIWTIAHVALGSSNTKVSA